MSVKQPKTTDSMTAGMRDDMSDGMKYAVIWRNFSGKHGDSPDTRYVHRKWRKIGRTT